MAYSEIGNQTTAFPSDNVSFRKETIRLTDGEVPHFFLDPSSYVEGVRIDSITTRIKRDNNQRVVKSTSTGFREYKGIPEVLDLDFSAPGFIERAVSKAKGRNPRNRLKVKIWSQNP